ncbi:MAG: septum formation initiator family protein [Firmicutes bacterium]|nr:septum formation initiator family protein [Bacillota bacterium]
MLGERGGQTSRTIGGDKGGQPQLSTIRVLLVLGAFIFVVQTGYGLVAGAIQWIDVNRELNAVRQERLALQAANRQLEQQIAYRKTDQYVEEQARSLGMVRPGEIPVRVVRPGQAQGAPDVVRRQKQRPVDQLY